MSTLLSALLASSAQAQTAPSISTASVDAAPSVSTAAQAGSVVVPAPWVLGEIKVEGNKNVKTGVVRGQVKAKKGDLYDRPDLDRDVQSILGLGGFERVSADVTLSEKPVPEHLRRVAGAERAIRLTILVKEKPQIKKVKFAGNKKVSKGALEDVASLKAKDPFDAVKLRDDQEKMTAKYREKGFLDASVSADVQTDTGTLQTVIAYNIVEGPKSRIALVTIDGIAAFKPKKILKQMKNRRKKVFIEKELPEDIKKIETFYLNRGYSDVTLSSPTVTVSPDKTKIYIALGVSEGPQYRFGDTTFSGYALFKSSELVKTIEYKRGKIFNQEKYEETIRAIQELYAEHARLRTRVTPTKTFNKDTGLMDVSFDISEGNIVYIDHVDVEGNKSTKNYVLKREVVVKPGDAFRRSRIIKSRERIMNLGFIDDVEIDVQSPSDPDRVDLAFDVVEGKPGILTAGAAFSSVDGLIGTLSLQHLNLFGRAQRASAQWSFGSRVQDYSLSWTTPWVRNKPVSLGFDLFNTRRINPFDNSLSAYVQKRTGGAVRVGPRFQEDKYQLNFTYTLSKVAITNVQSQFTGQLSEGTSIFSSLGVEFARDTRDNIWDPTRGTRNSVGVELSGGPLRGNIHFLKTSLTQSANFQLFSVADWPFVLTFANRAGYVTQFGETKEVPVFDRFFIGGQDTLRGYSASGEVGHPSGGKVYDVFNTEFSFPLARERKKTIVKFVTFLDVGTAWDRVRDISGRVGSGRRDLKTDVGFGIRFTTPAFPIRLDWGYGFNHRPGEKLYQINFGLGNLF
jgi:outer membrane protein insertion porin family